MKALGTVLLALAIVFALAYVLPAVAVEERDPVFEGFKLRAKLEAQAQGAELVGCEASIVDKQPDGPGRVILFGCKNLKYLCVFVAAPSEDALGGVAVRPLQCEENPDYEAPLAPLLKSGD